MNVTRVLTRTFIAAAGIGAFASLTAFGGPDITKDRLERSLEPTFAHLYVQRAQILGETGVTFASIQPKANCDRGGPKVKDVGPGADWICHIIYNDDKGKQQDGKFEVQAKANSTYVAGGPTKLMGPPVITNTRTGKDVPNPTSEWDGVLLEPNY